MTAVVTAATNQRLGHLQTRGDVAAALSVSEKYLTFILYGPTTKRTYRRFVIPKKSGGTRTISAPRKELRALQDRLKAILDAVYRPRPFVHGFIRDRSALTNALPHIRKRWVLNLDLEEFFPSINFGRVRGMLMRPPYEAGPAAATVIARICCVNNELPQGAPTSPVLANMVCSRFDGQLLQLARRANCTYTRYADDLSFSTRARDFPSDLATPVEGWTGAHIKIGPELDRVIVANGFRVSEKKSRLQFKDCHQDVTGITVNRLPNVRRSYVRQIRAMIHAWEKHGLGPAEQHFRQFYDTRARSKGVPPSFRLVIKGKLDYLRMVRGEKDRLYRRLHNQLHGLDSTLIPYALPIKPATRGGPSDAVWTQWAARYEHSIFQVEVRNAGVISGGTAFAYKRGLLATAEHVIVGDLAVEAPHLNKTSIKRISVHPDVVTGYDVAVLHLPGASPHMPYIPIDINIPERGEPIAVLGYPAVPLRLPTLVVAEGIVEAMVSDLRGQLQYIQISANLAGGMSGAPVINVAGSVIGIVSEQTFEQTAAGVPARAFHQALPVKHIRSVDVNSVVDVHTYTRSLASKRQARSAPGVGELLARVGEAIGNLLRALGLRPRRSG